MSFAASAVGVMAVVIVARYLVVLTTLRAQHLAPATAAEHIAVNELPAAHAELLALAAPRLEALGFTLDYASRAQSLLVTTKPCPNYSTTWWHAESGAFAVVTLNDQPEYDSLYLVSFFSFYAPSPHLFTVARRAHGLAMVHPDFSLADSGRDLEHQWQTHRERMATRAHDRLIIDKTQVFDIERRAPIELRAFVATSELFEVKHDGSARLTWRGAWRYMRRYTAGARALQSQPLAAAAGNGVAADDPRATRLRIEADVIALGAALAAARVEAGSRFKAMLLLLTGGASLLLFGWRFDWLFAGLLVAVLLLHELGHLAAMRWAGYRDLKIFFIPLIGAMASGREQQASAWHKMLVLLAGPLPGIVLGCALLHGLAAQVLPHAMWLVMAASLLIAINVLNLLPFVPLDGGRFFDELLVARLPRWRGAFAALGAFGMMALGWWFAEPLIAALGGLLLIGVPTAYRQAQLLAALRSAHRTGMDEDGKWLAALARLLVDTPQRALPYARRLMIARNITASSLAPAPSWAAVAAGLAVYGFALALPAWVFMQHGIDVIGAVGARVERGAPPQTPAAVEAELAAAPSAAARLGIMLRAAAAAEDVEDYARAYDFYQRALMLCADVADSQAQRVDATLGMARNGEQPAAMRTQLEALLAMLDAPDRHTRLQRARVQSALSQRFTAAGRGEDIARLTDVVAVRSELMAADDVELLDARQALAWLLWEDGQNRQALTQLQARLAAVLGACRPDCAPDQAWLRIQAYLDVGWLLLALDQHLDAARLVAEQGAQLRAIDAALLAQDQRVAVLHAWILAARGDRDGAEQALLAVRETPRSVFEELQTLIDSAVFAERNGDQTSARQRLDAFKQRVAALRRKAPALNLAWLRNSSDAPYVWQRARLEAEVDWLARHDAPLLEAAP